MNSKIPCTKCGALILPTTAEGTGGICRPCNKDDREDMVQCQEFYENWRKTLGIETDLWRIPQSIPEGDKLWAGLYYAFEQGMGFLIPSDNASGEAHCIEVIQKLVLKHGYDDLYACLKAHDADDSHSLYWFARSGVSQSIDAIERHLTSEDVDDVFYAAISLALLKDERGLEIVEKLCAGEHPVKLEETPGWYLDEYIQDVDHPKARELEDKYCNQGLLSQNSSTTRSNTMKWEKLIDSKVEHFFRSIVFRFPAQYPFESVVDFMLIEDLYAPAEYSLMCSTGYHAGMIELRLPEESMHADGGISVQWLKDNWQKWVYKNCKVEEVKFINQYCPQIGEHE